MAQFQKATDFKVEFKTNLNNNLKIMLNVCRHGIKRNINESNFLAIQSDSSTDISNLCHMVMINITTKSVENFEHFLLSCG